MENTYLLTESQLKGLVKTILSEACSEENDPKRKRPRIGGTEARKPVAQRFKDNDKQVQTYHSDDKNKAANDEQRRKNEEEFMRYYSAIEARSNMAKKQSPSMNYLTPIEQTYYNKIMPKLEQGLELNPTEQSFLKKIETKIGKLR